MRSSSKYQQIRKEAPRNAPGRAAAQSSRVVRHFAGKRGAAAVSDSDEESDYEEEEEENIDENEDRQEKIHQNDAPIDVGKHAGDYNIQEAHQEEGEEEPEEAMKPKMMIKPITAKIVDRPVEPPVVKAKLAGALQKPAPKPSIKAAPPPESSSEEEESSDEEESSSESDAPVLVKPTFISKAKRGQAAGNKPAATANTKPDAAAAAAAKRKEETLALAEHSLQHQVELEALLQQTSALDTELAQVDDTDDTDAAAERAAWRLRELARLRRDREALIERERAREELEALRENTTEQQRESDALQLARRRKEEKEENNNNQKSAADGQGNYMQRYYHKGAFFQEDEFIKNRDFSGAVEDDYQDKRALPKALQARTSGEVGLRGRSKYRSLAEEDTSRGALWDVAAGGRRPRERDGDGYRQYKEDAELRDPDGEEAYRRRREK